MKKIAIVTITNSGLNFGNRLQNYALQHVLEKYSADVRTIFASKGVYNSLLLSKLRRRVKMAVKSGGRRRHFNKFDKSYIKKGRRIRYEHINDNKFNAEYDAFIAGSDQVWNPDFHFNSAFEFLTFAEPSKRFSYAASFGVSDIADARKAEYAGWLSGMRALSVREEQGREIIRRLTGRDAGVHIDPTMLLDAAHYAGMEQKPEQAVPAKYMLTYFLGEKKPEYAAFAAETAGHLGLPVIELSESPGAAFCDIGPQHFIYLLRHAGYICTDSFHGTAFAVIFGKLFTTFYRRKGAEDMQSRIDTLFDKLGLRERLFGGLDVADSVKGIAYGAVGERLEREREAAHEYLRGLAELRD